MSDVFAELKTMADALCMRSGATVDTVTAGLADFAEQRLAGLDPGSRARVNQVIALYIARRIRAKSAPRPAPAQSHVANAAFRDVQNRIKAALREDPNASADELLAIATTAATGHLAREGCTLDAATAKAGSMRGAVRGYINKQVGRYRLTVAPGWSRAPVNYAEEKKVLDAQVFALLQDAASHMLKSLPARGYKIEVRPGRQWRLEYPSTTDTHILFLTARDTYWCRIALEFLVLLAGVVAWDEQKDRRGVNAWVEDSLCVAAALATMKAMAETWVQGDSPVPDGAAYAPHLHAYVESYVAQNQVGRGKRFSHWLGENEPRLRRGDNCFGVAAAQMLPHFARDPTQMGALRSLPACNGSLDELFEQWEAGVKAERRPFVQVLRAGLTL